MPIVTDIDAPTLFDLFQSYSHMYPVPGDWAAALEDLGKG